MAFKKGKDNIKFKHGKRWTSEYKTWSCLRDRCRNSKARDYKNYGGRGITVCERWDSFENFLNDMGLRPEGMSLDRIDNDKGYSKDNCRWADKTTQNRNQRVRKDNKFGCKGVYYCNTYKRFKAVINVNKKRINLGTFKNKEDAIKARKEAELKYW